MPPRSRTGCLTCRQRKLKCDESQPICGQCAKRSRDCVYGAGLTWRHEQNPALNRDLGGAGDSLGRFYSYRNTFEDDNIWLDVPDRLTFILVKDPYADADGEDESVGAQSPSERGQPFPEMSLDGRSSASRQSDATDTPAAASASHRALASPARSSNLSSALTRSVSSPNANRPQQTSSRGLDHDSKSTPRRLISAGKDPFNVLNPTSPPPPTSASRQSTIPAPSANLCVPAEGDAEHEHYIGCLLRHYSEVCGLWMDLYDLHSYFSHYVPVKAATNPVLKYAAAAYAAKHLSLLSSKPIMGGPCALENRAFLELPPDGLPHEWSIRGKELYHKALQLMRQAIDERQGSVVEASDDGGEGVTPEARSQSRSEIPDAGTMSDEMAAATAILCNYELLDFSGTEWSIQLDGAKSLLDIAERKITSTLGSEITKSRKATFWNFCRQDTLSALIQQRKTRLDTFDLSLWISAGLFLDDFGMVRPSNTLSSGYPDGHDMMREDMISNALLWIVAKIVNYIQDVETFQRAEPDKPSPFLTDLEERHRRVLLEMDHWSRGCPSTFRACVRIEAKDLPSTRNEFPEVWFSIAMCASARQWYHLGCILLDVYRPRRLILPAYTFRDRFLAQKDIWTDVRANAEAMCSISAGRPSGDMRIHSVQPLFYAGLCLDEPQQRRGILKLLRGIEQDTGWASEYRVQKLLELWGWDDPG